MLNVPKCTGATFLAIGLYTTTGGGGGTFTAGVSTGFTSWGGGVFNSGFSTPLVFPSPIVTRNTIASLVDPIHYASTPYSRGFPLECMIRCRSLLRYGFQLHCDLPLTLRQNGHLRLFSSHSNRQPSRLLLLLNKLHLHLTRVSIPYAAAQFVDVELLSQLLPRFHALSFGSFVVLVVSHDVHKHLSLLLLTVLLLWIHSRLHSGNRCD